MVQTPTAPANSRKKIASPGSLVAQAFTTKDDLSHKQWIFKSSNQDLGELSDYTQDDILRSLLANRGILTARAADKYLKPEYSGLKLFKDSVPLKDLDKAVDILSPIIKSEGVVLIFGDYDVDGVCATALMKNALTKLGAKVLVQLPHRERDGYGLQVGSVNNILANKPSLVLTVDNGAHSHAAIALLKKEGVPVIVVDHHEVGETLPEAVAFINPKRRDESPEVTYYCATGVAYRLAEKLFDKFNVPAGQEKWLLDLAAVATVCDMVPLEKDNRAIVYFGLKTLANTRRIGLRWLLDHVGADQVDSDVIGFRIGPRLNAAGRLVHAQEALNLVMADNEDLANKAGLQLEQLNQERKNLTKKVFDEATQMAYGYVMDPSMVLADQGWPRGVCGLAASRLVEKFNKPVFVLEESSPAVGSGRSVPGFDLAEALREISTLFERCGGHAAAAGCTIQPENIPVFREKLNELVIKKRGAVVPRPTIEYELEIKLEQANLDFIDIQNQLAPFGMNNRRPVVRFNACEVVGLRQVGKDAQHLIFQVKQGSEYKKGIAFNKAADWSEIAIGSKIDILATISENNWQGRRSVELEILDLKALNK